MPSITSVIPADFGYVGLSIAAAGIVTTWQGSLVTSARRKAKIAVFLHAALEAYSHSLRTLQSQCYATPEQQAASRDALVFNCAQRAHHNTLENLPFALASTLFTGFLAPKFAAGSMAVWLLGRIAYTLGYTTGDPKKRQAGVFGYFGLIGLLLGPIYLSYRMITDKVL